MAAGGMSQKERWTSRPAADIQDLRRRVQFQPSDKLPVLICCQPTILTNVLAKSLLTDLRENLLERGTRVNHYRHVPGLLLIAFSGSRDPGELSALSSSQECLGLAWGEDQAGCVLHRHHVSLLRPVGSQSFFSKEGPRQEACQDV